MYLFLKWLEYENFMGGTMRIEFTKNTDIFGANGSGKSRFKHAYSYLVTGRDADDNAKFPIKDTERPQMNILPHRVTAAFDRSPGGEIVFEKVYKEDWGSVQGSEVPVLTGHTIIYKIDGENKTATAYKQIMDTLIPAALLKMLSDPLYFPDKMEWEDQRKVLELMANDITDEYVLGQIATPKKDFSGVVSILNNKKSLEDRKSQLKYKINELKNLRTPITPKIEENTLQITKIGTIDEAGINAEIERLNKEIEEKDTAIADKTTAETQQNDAARIDRNQLNTLKNRQQDIENTHEREYKAQKEKDQTSIKVIEDTISGLDLEIKSKNTFLSSLKSKRAALDTEGQTIMTSWHEENAKDFPVWDENNFICDKCNRRHESDNIEETTQKLKDHFVANKKKVLLGLNDDWARVEKDIADNTKLTENAQLALDALLKSKETKTKELEDLKQKTLGQAPILAVIDRLKADEEFQGNIKKIADLTEKINKAKDPVDYGKLKEERAALSVLVDTEKTKLQQKTTLEYLQKRNSELAEEQKSLSKQIATLERENLEIDEFVIAKSNMIEEAIRSKFQKVTFKMFRTNIGETTPKPACELWFEGKPWKALNTGSKLNAGLDIINALSTHYGIFPPLLLDNRESVHDVIETKSQTINFFVNKPDKVLRIENH